MTPWPKSVIATPTRIRSVTGRIGCQWRPLQQATQRRWIHPVPSRFQSSDNGDRDPRLRDLGREIWDDYASLRESYGTYRIHTISSTLN